MIDIIEAMIEGMKTMIAAIGEMLTTGLLIMALGVSLILIFGLILDTIEGSKK